MESSGDAHNVKRLIMGGSMTNIEAGWYWAKKKSADEWDSIAWVYGTKPFFKVEVFTGSNNGTTSAKVDMGRTPLMFGEKIVQPEDDVDM